MRQQDRSKAGSAWMYLCIAIVLSPITLYAVVWVSTDVMAQLDEGWHPTWFGDSSNAQILVFTPDHAADGFSVDLIPVSVARSYTASHPDWTFVIPMDRKDQVQERLKTGLKLSWTTFEIKQLSDSDEEITLYFMDRTDDSHGSRYKANKDGVQLESYRYVADRGAVGIVFFAMLLTLAIHVLVLGFLLIRAIYLTCKNRRSTKVVTFET